MERLRVRGVRQLQLRMSGKETAGTVGQDHEKTGACCKTGKEITCRENGIDYTNRFKRPEERGGFL